MKKLILILSLAVLYGCSSSKSHEPFFFIQFTDTQMGFQEEGGSVERSVAYLTDAVNAVNRLKPAFVVVTGDMVNHWNSTTEWEAYENQMKNISEDIPVYTIPGNHDWRPAKEPGSDKAYLERYGTDRFCFMYNDALCIGYNSCYIKENDEAKEAEQFDWIVRQIKRYGKKADHILLFSHCPIIRQMTIESEDYFNYQEPYRSKYLKLCEDYNVEAVISGHYHRARYYRWKGTHHITCTSTGEPLGDGFPGINVVAITPDTLTFNMSYQFNALNPFTGSWN